MINAKLEQFLDTGWYSEATIYYNGYIYWCESQKDEKNGQTKFIVDKWAAKNENNEFYHSLTNLDGSVEWERVLCLTNDSLDIIKKDFLTSPIFDGKTFWEVENQLAWLEEGSPQQKS